MNQAISWYEFVILEYPTCYRIYQIIDELEESPIFNVCGGCWLTTLAALQVFGMFDHFIRRLRFSQMILHISNKQLFHLTPRVPFTLLVIDYWYNYIEMKKLKDSSRMADAESMERRRNFWPSILWVKDWMAQSKLEYSYIVANISINEHLPSAIPFVLLKTLSTYQSR